jgi:hypothetical protein
LHVATIHHRVPEITQVTNRRHPGRQLTQSLSDDRVQLIVAEPEDLLQEAHKYLGAEAVPGVRKSVQQAQAGPPHDQLWFRRP